MAYHPEGADKSYTEDCCCCIKMYSGFKCLSWCNAIFGCLRLIDGIVKFMAAGQVADQAADQLTDE